MFAVDFYKGCFVSRGNSIGKKLIRLDWEKTVYRPLFTLANTLSTPFSNVSIVDFQNLNVSWVIYQYPGVAVQKHS